MRLTNEDIMERWLRSAIHGFGRKRESNGKVHYRDDTLYSTGQKFVLATVIRPKNRGAFVLLNGDMRNLLTTRHQEGLRALTMGRTSNWRISASPMIVPFAALKAAGIDKSTILPIEVRADSEEEIRHTSKNNSPTPAAGQVRPNVDSILAWQPWRREYGAWIRGRWVRVTYNVSRERWEWIESRHRLGDSVFTAVARGRRRTFLSSFDYQEPNPLYFLCELPRGKIPTVAAAYEALKPESVKAAEKANMGVVRQGDMFAIETDLDEDEVLALTPNGKGRSVKMPRRGLLGTNHTATHVIFATHGRVYAKGCLYHKPEDREPDHKRQKMGNGRTWHLLVRNTVPRVQEKPKTREVV